MIRRRRLLGPEDETWTEIRTKQKKGKIRMNRSKSSHRREGTTRGRGENPSTASKMKGRFLMNSECEGEDGNTNEQNHNTIGGIRSSWSREESNIWHFRELKNKKKRKKEIDSRTNSMMENSPFNGGGKEKTPMSEKSTMARRKK